MGPFYKELDNLILVLVRPNHPENVGFVARAALNTGISKLRVVCESFPESERMLATATHNARRVVEAIEYHGDLAAADSNTTGVALDADGNLLGATGSAGEIYTMTWDVNDTNNPHTITATVGWDGIGTSQVVLMSLVNDD